MDLEKSRKHKWVTEALNAGELELSVWPSPEEISDKKKQEKFFEIVARVGADPRVTSVQKKPHRLHQVVYVFHLRKDA